MLLPWWDNVETINHASYVLDRCNQCKTVFARFYNVRDLERLPDECPVCHYRGENDVPDVAPPGSR